MTEKEQLEQAIAALEAQRATLGDVVVDPAIAGLKMQLADIEPSPSPYPQQQRKQVTVLFADVSGFTAMSETMDAEDVNEVMNALWEKVDGAIVEHNGRIDKHIGDAVMALWGVDEAREDDPEQAIQAALAMQTAVQTFVETQNFASLQMRIGINTGPVLLAEVGTISEFTAMGDTVNTASRLEQASPVGSILISHDTYRHVRGVFDMEPQAPLSVKGKVEPLQVYVVKRGKARAFRTHTRGVEGVETRMVGRDAELQRLQELWQTAVSTSQTTFITIVGEAGVGKSRLLYEFEQWLDLQPQRVALFKGRSAEQTQGTPNFLLRDLLANRFDIRESDPIVEVRQKFETAITDVLTDAAEAKAHFLGQWLGYDFGHSPHVATIGEDAEQLKNRGVLYLSQLLKRVAGERPLLLFLEDIHWADAPSLAAILDVLRREPALPLLVVALTRSSLFEHHPTWQELGQENKIEGLFDNEPAYYFVNLNPLPSTADHELLAEILQKVADIPPKLFNLVADRAEGNPFYMEEFVKMLIDGGVIEPGKDLWQVDLAHLDERRIPGTLTGVLQARLDRLAVEERGTLQRAAVIGRVFWDTAVQRLSGDRDQVQLVSLQKRELIYRQSETAFVNTHQFLFKHDLLRDVTYQTVLKKARQLYHGRVADWLVEVAGVNGRTDEYAAVIAEHYQLAEQQDKAAHWYGRAGQDAATRYAHSQAIHYLILALDLTAKDDNTTRYTLLSAREKVYDLQGNRQAQFEDLEQLASVVDGLGIIEQATAALRQARYADMTGEYDYAIICAQAAIELGQPQDHTDIVSAGHEIWGKALWHQGQFLAAQEKYLAGLQLARTGANPRLVRDCLAGLGDVAWNQGEYASAQGYYEQALAICQENGDRQGEGESLKNLGNVALYQGEYTSAQGYYEQALAICRNIGNRQVEGESLNNLGNVALYQGDYASAQRYYKQSLAICREMGDRQGEATSLNNLGVVARRQGEYASAQKYYEQSLAIRQVIGDRKGEGESFNNLGLATWGQGDYASTKRHYEHSLAISQEIGDRKGEGICLHNLAFIASYQREYASALKYYEQSLAIRQEIGDQWGEGESLNELGVVARRQGDYASAQRYYEQSLAIKQKIGDRRGEGYSLNNLGTVALCQGEYMVAQRYLEQSLAIFRETGDRLDEGESLNQLGALMLARSNLQLAELYYQQAVAIHEELNQPHCLVENWAGLAKVKLVKGVQENAWKYAQQILEYLNTNPQLNGVESPIRTFHFIWDVLIALGQIGEAKGVLSLAIQAMQDYLDKNSDPTTQAMYLGQPHHQVLWVAWQQRQETH